jgi:hypothetical protein
VSFLGNMKHISMGYRTAICYANVWESFGPKTVKNRSQGKCGFFADIGIAAHAKESNL